MNIFQFGSRVLSRTSPLGLAVGGAVLALSIPAVRKGLRKTTVVALSGIISVTDEAKRVSAHSRQKLHAFVNEIKQGECGDSCQEITRKIRSKPRKLAVAATAGVLTISDKAKGLATQATDEFKSIVADARSLRDQPNTVQDEAGEIKDGLEGGLVDLPDHH